MTDLSISLPAKRRRGRPRKDGGLPNKTAPRVVPTTYPVFDTRSENSPVSDDMVGSAISGVVETAFDAGYLISVRIGNNDTPFRGVVFQPKKIVPLTPANDVAPQATMYRRQEIKVPLNSPEAPPPSSEQAVFSPANQSYYNNQPAFMLRTSSVPNMGGTSNTQANHNSPRVVHHADEAITGGFEAPSRGTELTSTHPNIGFQHNFMGPKDMYYVGDTKGSFHQELFAQPPEFQSLQPKFDLTSNEKRCSPENHLQTQSYLIDNEMKSPVNLGYQHGLVSGNPLMLTSEFPLGLMLKKNMSGHETTRAEGASSPSDPYKL